MRVEVVVHRSVEPAFAAWKVTLGATLAEREQRFAELWDEFVRAVVAAGGPPAGSIEDATTRPPSWWCDFPGGMAQVVVEVDRRLVVLERRRVRVTKLVFSPGLGG